MFLLLGTIIPRNYIALYKTLSGCGQPLKNLHLCSQGILPTSGIKFLAKKFFHHSIFEGPNKFQFLLDNYYVPITLHGKTVEFCLKFIYVPDNGINILTSMEMLLPRAK